ncbi:MULTISPECIES: hypothetical protein [Vibrio]|uniref:hypothetical protein n=1 Tax=Vibrio TaxID=662 RepID=UPI000758E471|nr:MULTISPECIES: hypothetical protein [Vibrio]EIE1271970.1 hypothetical protein [Vibrio parahaemolyticus]MCG9230207.1 hypothetical protein [Vibrio diabolicus]MCG9573531.1 hypothetical protein [Vibrio diabolicus]MCG9594658.1 hypothetical protein [Vibrio diabolicus]MDW2327804.1 hypothetical protein [Vibrio sp. 1401]
MNITQSFISNIKKLAKKIQVELGVKHTQALELAAREVGFPNYHSLLQHSKKANNHRANIVNANKGMDGVNQEFAMAQGNRGKQLNPNQNSSLLVIFDDDLMVNELEYEGTTPKLIRRNFKAEYLDKGFATDIGARILSFAEVKHRDLDIGYGSQLHQWGYICVEFLRNRNNPWTIEDANEIAKERIGSKFGSCYREFFFIDGEYVNNHVYDERTTALDLENDRQYHPAIDGYHDNYS